MTRNLPTNNENSNFARAVFIFVHFEALLVLSATWMTCLAVISTKWRLKDKFQNCLPIFKRLIPILFLDNESTFWELKGLEIIYKWLRKQEVKFSDNVFAVVDIVFALLSSPDTSNSSCTRNEFQFIMTIILWQARSFCRVLQRELSWTQKVSSPTKFLTYRLLNTFAQGNELTNHTT